MEYQPIEQYSQSLKNRAEKLKAKIHEPEASMEVENLIKIINNLEVEIDILKGKKCKKCHRNKVFEVEPIQSSKAQIKPTTNLKCIV